MPFTIANLTANTSYEKLSNLNLILENATPVILVKDDHYRIYLINQKNPSEQTSIALEELAAKVSQIAEENKTRKSAFDGVLHPKQWKAISCKITQLCKIAEQVVKRLPDPQFEFNRISSFDGKTIETHFKAHDEQRIKKATKIYAKNLERILNKSIEKNQTNLHANDADLFTNIPKSLMQDASFKTSIQERAHSILEKKFTTRKKEVNWTDLIGVSSIKCIRIRDTTNDEANLAEYYEYLNGCRR